MTRVTSALPCFLLIATLAAACGDGTSTTGPDAASSDTVSTSARWNQRAVALVVARQPASNGQAVVSRILTYVSLAQYRAVVAAQAASTQSKPPSIAAAVVGASAAVLESYFPLDSAATEQLRTTDLAVLPSSNTDIPAGEALGRSIGAAVLASAASDNYFATAPGPVPTGADYWVSSSAAVVRSLDGTRAFFLTSPGQFRLLDILK